MKNYFTLILALFLITSCTEDPEPNGVLIRVENSSEVDFKDIFISSGSPGIEIGELKAGQKSDFNEFETAYRYGFVRLIANGKELRIQPFDYVGETPLEKGYYTYKIGINNSDSDNPNLTLELVIGN